MIMASKYTCRFCKEQFDQPKGLYKHLHSAHNVGSSRDNRSCPICGVLCSKYESYRDHLLYIHGQSNEGQQFSFKTLNEFLLWKTELEMKYHCKYILQSAPKVLSTKEKKYFYQCDGSGSKSKDRKTVIMKSCSSVISVVEGTGVFKVEYWDTHSAHAKSAELTVQNELEAAISSVEMVNAIADSDDSLDKSEEYAVNANSSSYTPVEKVFVKPHVSPSVNNLKVPVPTITKTKTLESLKSDSAKKKVTNTSMLFSLASVACGKGISKKSTNKINSSKVENESKADSKDSEKDREQNDKTAISSPVKKGDSTTVSSPTKITSPTKCAITSTAITNKSPSISFTPKVATPKSLPPGPLAIAPKPASLKNSSISSLFASNTVYPNQLLIVNPVGMDQNTNQNVITAGQNIVLSLPLGQNILPGNAATPQSINHTPINEDKESDPAENAKSPKDETLKRKALTVSANTTVNNLLGVSQSSLTTKKNTVKNLLNNTQILSSSSTASTTTSVATPITLASGINNNTPVLLSSLPVGSTFMSVNNSLIPIASPSGAFLPSSLPPNIVLTPVPSTVMSNTQSAPLSSVSSSVGSNPSNIVLPTSLPHNLVLTPVLPNTTVNSQSSSKITFSPHVGSSPGTFLPTSLASNIVLAPLIPSGQSVLKTTDSQAGSSVQKSLQNQLCFSLPSTPITVSSIVKEPVYSSSSIKLTNSIITSSTISSEKSLGISKKAKHTTSLCTVTSPTSINKSATKATRDKNSVENLQTFNKLGGDITISRVNNSTANAKSSILSTLPVAKKARKTFSKQVKASTISGSAILDSSIKTVSAMSTIANTNVVNSQLNLAPISSTPNVTVMPDQVNSGTLIFESSGEIFMLEPIESNSFETRKIKIDRSIQTVEDFDTDAFKSKSNRKRNISTNEDDAIMMKVKCYQLEMQYLNSQADCKQLKIELTKERLKNAEFTGENVATNSNEETPGESRNMAREIMKDIEDKFRENKDADVYTLTKTSVLRSLYDDVEELCLENADLRKELENYRSHDKFYKSLKKKLFDEDF